MSDPRAGREVRLLRRTPVTDTILELAFTRPPGFLFAPGQSVALALDGGERDYSIASGRDDGELRFLMRLVQGGAMSGRLAALREGAMAHVAGPRGFLVFEPGPRPVVLVATGTGIAPFLSMIRSGLRGFTLLHGVARAEDLVGADEVQPAAASFVPCVSRGPAPDGGATGRVTTWADTWLAPAAYDFYLCGRKEMVRDMTLIIDRRFPGSSVRTEIFF